MPYKSTRKAAAMTASSSTGASIAPPSVAGVFTSTAGVQSPTVISTPQTNSSAVRFEGERKPYFSAPSKMSSYAESDDEDNETIEIINETDRVQVLTCNDITDTFVTAPRTFQSNRKTYAIFGILIPTCYTADYVSAIINEDGYRCEISFRRPKETLHACIIANDLARNFNGDSGLYEAINDWKESQQEHSGDDITKTITLKLPFQSISTFSATLLPQGGFINTAINLPNHMGVVRQLTLVFEEKSDNTFNRETAVDVNLDFAGLAVSPPANPMSRANISHGGASAAARNNNIHAAHSSSSSPRTPTTNQNILSPSSIYLTPSNGNATQTATLLMTNESRSNSLSVAVAAAGGSSPTGALTVIDTNRTPAVKRSVERIERAALELDDRDESSERPTQRLRNQENIDDEVEEESLISFMTTDDEEISL